MLSLIVILPFFSALLMAIVYLGNTKEKRYFFYTLIGVGTPAVSTILSFMVGNTLLDGSATIHHTLFQWISVGDFNIEVAFMADRLSVVMISFITFIGTLIHIYAAGYMKEDESYGKFFSYFNLFMGSMLLLVLADNPFMMFVGWELVGLSSYLLSVFIIKNLPISLLPIKLLSSIVLETLVSLWLFRFSLFHWREPGLPLTVSKKI